MGKRCCVKRCAVEEKEVQKVLTFHTFPTSIHILKMWQEAIIKENKCALEFHDKYVCSRHFTPIDYVKLTRLSPVAIPTVFLEKYTDFWNVMPKQEVLNVENADKISEQFNCDERNQIFVDPLPEILHVTGDSTSPTLSKKKNHKIRYHGDIKIDETRTEKCLNDAVIRLKIALGKEQKKNRVLKQSLYRRDQKLASMNKQITNYRGNELIKKKNSIGKTQMICRGCLCDKQEVLVSFLDNPSLLDMYVGCTFLQVEIGDGLPLNLCLKCAEICSSWHSFKKLCEQNELILRKRLNVNETITATNDSLNSDISMIKKETNYEPLENFYEEVNIKNEIIDNINCLNDITMMMPENLSNQPPSPELLIVNYKQIENTMTYNCYDCKATFTNSESLEAHQKLHAVVHCEICNKDLKNKEILRTHIKAVHLLVKRYSCTICQKQFRTNYLFTLHMRNHTGERPFKCDICTKRFVSKNHLNSHMRSHSNKKPFLCAECGKSYKKCSAYKVHLLLHTGERPYACTLCSNSFKTKRCLQTHVRNHTRETPYECPLCGRKCIAYANLRLHLKTHARQEEMKNLPKEKTKFKCKVCAEIFESQRKLSEHLKSHSGKLVFECTYCDKVFKHKVDLIIHLRRHTGEKPFACTICTEAFASQKSLKHHNITKHSYE